MYLYCEFLDYFSFKFGSQEYDDLVAINQYLNAKRLIFVFPGGSLVCCDALMEDLDDYRAYTYIWKGRVEYKQEYNHLLTDEEI